MFNLYQIVTGAQGGQALDNLASQFGITREQADNTVKALMPALSTAFMTKAAHPGGLQDVAGALDDDHHRQAYADPGTAQAPTTEQKGGDVASSIFGNSAIVQEVVQQASKYTGVPAATIQQMLPVIVSIVLGGVATAMHNQGMGGILGQISKGLGGLFGQAGGVPGQAGGAPGQAGGGGFGGMFGDILGSVLGGGQHASPQQPTPEPAQPATGGTAQQPAPGGGIPGLPPAIQAGMEALGKLFQPGVQGHPGLPSDLGQQISSILGSKR